MPDAAYPRGPITTLEWATFYASLGWSVVPVRPGDKLPAVPWAAFQRQPATPSEIHGWYATGGYGIGLVQGARSGTIVLDFDGEEGMATLASLESRYGGFPATVKALTPGGGVHVILRHPGRAVPTRKNVMAGMDVRGDGGFIVAHPSRHGNGRQYQWDVDAHPEEVPVADCPAWVAEIICGEAPAGAGAAVPMTMSQTSGPLGMMSERVADGREAYMRDTILAVLVDLSRTLGRLPTEAELTEAAWPQYERRVDFSRPGRGADEFTAKVRYTLARATKGLIRGVQVPTGEGQPAGEGHNWEGDGGPFGGTAEAVPDIYPTYSLDEIMAMPPPTWLVSDLITQEGFAVFFGPPGSLKSFVALGMGLSIAYGRPWMGREVAQGGVLYMAAEGVSGLGKRIDAWQRKHGLQGVDAPFRLLTVPVNLTEPAAVQKLVRTALAAAKTEGVPIKAVFVDTVAKSMTGAEENSATEMGKFVAACDAVKSGVQATIIGIHHSGKDLERGMRGSNALKGGVDTEIEVKRDDDRVTLTVLKQKDAEEGSPIYLIKEEVQLSTGIKPHKSLVLVQPGSDFAPPPSQAASLLEQIARALGHHKARVPLRRVGEALGMTSGHDRKALAQAVPFSPSAAEVMVDGQVVRLWKTAEGDTKTAPLLLVREDIS